MNKLKTQLTAEKGYSCESQKLAKTLRIFNVIAVSIAWNML